MVHADLEPLLSFSNLNHTRAFTARPEHLVPESIGSARASQRAQFDKTVVDAQGQLLTVNDQRSLVNVP